MGLVRDGCKETLTVRECPWGRKTLRSAIPARDDSSSALNSTDQMRSRTQQ